MRISRKVLIGITLVIIVALVGGTYIYYYLQEQIGAEERKRTLIIGTTATLENLDVVKTVNLGEYMTTTLMYEGLMAFPVDRLGPAELNLAEDYSVSADLKTWTYKLRKGVTFHDGTPFTAVAVKEHIDRQKEKGAWKFLFKEVESVEVVDNYTVVIHAAYPFSEMNELAANNQWIFPSPTAIKELGEERFNTEGGIGTGPWKVKEFIPKERLVLDKNTDYWNKELLPEHIDRIIISVFGDSTSLRIALTTGEIDMAFKSIYAEEYELLRQDPNIKMTPAIDAALWIRPLCIYQDVEPTNNKLVRQAIAYAIDYDKIINLALKGEAIRPLSWVPQHIFPEESVEVLAKYTRNVTKAKELLAQAGYTNGVKITFTWSTRAAYGITEGDVALVIADSLREAGFDVELGSLDWASYLDGIINREIPNLFLPSWPTGGEWMTPLSTLDSLSSKGFLGAGVGYNNSLVDALLAEGLISLEPSEYKEIVKQLQEIIAEDLPLIPLWIVKDYVFSRNDRIIINGFPKVYWLFLRNLAYLSSPP